MRLSPAVHGEPGSMVLPNIVAQHAEESASLWHIRETAVRSRACKEEELGAIDDRVDGHLDGLRIAGDAGQDACRSALVRGGAGEAFAAATLAVERADVRAFAEVVARSIVSPVLARGVVAGLGWAPLARARRFLDELLARGVRPEMHYLGIAGSAVHRCDPGEPIAHAARADDLRLRARALRAIGELGRVDLLPALRHELGSDHDACRFWAAWSAALLGEPAAAGVLWRFALEDSGFAERAAGAAARSVDPAAACARVREVAARPTGLRPALAGAAASGDPALVPWVIACMETPATARLAGWAFTMIAGPDLSAAGLAAAPPPGFRSGPTDDPGDADVAADPDERLPWPDAGAVRAWWERHGEGLTPGRRLLLGSPIEPARLRQALRGGSLAVQAAAAMEIASTKRGRPLFEVRAPAFGRGQRRAQPAADD